jgi:hypothetical protein
MDVAYPPGSASKKRALIQTDPLNQEGDSAEIYLSESNGIATDATQFGGTIPADSMVRLAFVAQLSANPGTLTAFINGRAVGQIHAALDGRFSLRPNSRFQLFTDGFANGTQPGRIERLGVFDQPLAAEALFEAREPGPPLFAISTSGPYIVIHEPRSYLRASPAIMFSATIFDGINSLYSFNSNRFSLHLDDQVVMPTLRSFHGATLITYSSNGWFAPGSSHQWTLSMTNGTIGGASWTRSLGPRLQVIDYGENGVPAPAVHSSRVTLEDSTQVLLATIGIQSTPQSTSLSIDWIVPFLGLQRTRSLFNPSWEEFGTTNSTYESAEPSLFFRVAQ